MLKTGSKLRQTIAAVGVSVALIAGTAGPAAAASVHSSMVDFWPGHVGVYRTGTSSSHSFDFLATCYWSTAGSPTPLYAQMQLQRSSGISAPVSLGNKNVYCSSSSGSQNWGTQTVGQQYRYQYNGAKISGVSGLQSGPFSNSNILITY
ncbi:hypothetical protein [uncultured Schumannella sp.]|uniref:hypothetical protein n=1 Tax=uncultured Schumannella sp. TaxID=1195956 RepID=UPI0025F12DEE|nr:hypothetical protein [uncultured Schumannella sp.]